MRVGCGELPVGGYELRVMFGDGPIDEDELQRTLERFHVQHQAEYGHAFRDSVIEIVNVRLVGVAVRPKLEARPVARAGERCRPTMHRWFSRPGTMRSRRRSCPAMH